MSSTNQVQSLSVRLNALSDSLKTTLQLVNRLAKLNFQPGSTPLDSEEGDVRAELTTDIHESLKQEEENLELLRQEVEDLTGSEKSPQYRRESERDREKTRLSVQIVRLGEDLRHARSQFRKAQLTSKRNAEVAKRKERELLFNSLQEQATASDGDQSGRATPNSVGGIRRGGRTEKLSEDELLVNASSDVTAALRRTHGLIVTELQRSRFAQETLERGTSQLKQLDVQYTSLNSLLSNSKSLVSTLITSQKSDTWYLETAFWILVSTIGWLFFRRILYGPLALFVIWPVKLGFRLLLFVLSIIGLTGRSSSVAASSSIASQSIQASFSADPDISIAMAPSQAQGGQDPVQEKEQQTESAQGNLTEQIGRMIDESQKDSEPVKRGDGTVLPERGDVPKNPKKRVFDTGKEAAKEEARNRDEL